MTLAFPDYLDAKFPLDERSLNARVREAFLERLRGREGLEILDLGAGCLANAVRLLDWGWSGEWTLTALDRDGDLLEQGQRRLAGMLEARGFRVTPTADGLRAGGEGRSFRLRLLTADLEHFGVGESGDYDAILAHALLDLLPPALMAERIASWLRPGGLVFATLNYDGGTTLLPPYRDAAFEERILSEYDESMERRRVFGLPSGGAHSGRRLFGALDSAGLAIIGAGTSDWTLLPLAGRYDGREAALLGFLLSLIRGEAERSGAFDPAALEAWWAERMDTLAAGRLGLICHQLDLLAERPSAADGAAHEAAAQGRDPEHPPDPVQAGEG